MLVFALQLLRVFQSFEVEFLLGTPIDFYVYSTKIFALVRTDIPQYGEATALASITLLVIALIIPLQRWVLEAAPLHHYQWDLQTRPDRSWTMELHSVWRHCILAGAANHRSITHAGAGEFYDKNWVFRAWLHAETLEARPE